MRILPLSSFSLHASAGGRRGKVLRSRLPPERGGPSENDISDEATAQGPCDVLARAADAKKRVRPALKEEKRPKTTGAERGGKRTRRASSRGGEACRRSGPSSRLASGRRKAPGKASGRGTCNAPRRKANAHSESDKGRN